jgi:hypothetical protein
MDLRSSLDRFRLAARQVRNGFFALDPADPDWESHERFDAVESALFDALVASVHGLELGQYGVAGAVDGIVGVPRADRCPAMINRQRGVRSGQWDHPVRHLPRDTRLLLVSFFDWDQTASQDYHLVHVVIDACAAAPEVHGHHALIEFVHLDFELAAQRAGTA